MQSGARVLTSDITGHRRLDGKYNNDSDDDNNNNNKNNNVMCERLKWTGSKSDPAVTSKKSTKYCLGSSDLEGVYIPLARRDHSSEGGPSVGNTVETPAKVESMASDEIRRRGRHRSS